MTWTYAKPPNTWTSTVKTPAATDFSGNGVSPDGIEPLSWGSPQAQGEAMLHTSGIVACGPGSAYTIVDKHEGISLRYFHGALDAYTVTTPVITTPDGIQVTSTLEKLRATYPDLEASQYNTATNGIDDYYYLHRNGHMFTFQVRGNQYIAQGVLGISATEQDSPAALSC